MTMVPTENGFGQAVQQYQPQNLQSAASPQPATQPSGVMRLTEWAEEARAAAALAAGLVKTSFVPKAFAGRVEEAAAAILTGAEMGLSPMASLRAIYLIHGTPGMYAKTMRAVVQSHGHEVWVHEATATRAIVKGRRKGASQVETSTWTQDRAKTAGLTANDQYRKNPQNMLTARATAEVCWLIASDALHGIAASVEELEAGGDPGAVDVPTEDVAPPKRTAKRKPLERMESAEPALSPAGPATDPSGHESTPEQANPAGDAPSAPVEMVTTEQHRHMHALWRELGYSGDENREQRLTITAKILGLPSLDSSATLTEAQADTIIAKLRERKQAQGGEPA